MGVHLRGLIVSCSRLILVVAAATAVSGAVAGAALHDGAPRARLTLDADAPLFAGDNAANLLPGQVRDACVGVANHGDGAGRAALHAPGLSGELARYLTLTVTRGTRIASDRSRSCRTFAADAADLGAGAAGVVFRGRLSDFPGREAEALLDPDRWAPGTRRAYRFSLRLGDDPRAAGLSARWNWRMAVESLPAPRQATASASRMADRCETLHLAGAVSGRTRTLIRTVRLDRRVQAVLLLRTFGSAGATRVVLTTGLRVRGDKTLLVPRWASVRYRLNGRLGTVAASRPFRGRVTARELAPGRARISVAVQPRGGGPKRVTAFELAVTPATIGGRTVCVVSA